MLLRSNISTVIRNLERLSAEVPLAVRRATAPPRWSASLMNAARIVLQGLASATEKEPGALAQFIPALLDSFEGALTETGSKYEMQFLNRLESFPSAHLMPLLTAPNKEAAKAAVRQWVLAEKDLSRSEQGDPESAVRAMWEIFGLVPRPDDQYTENMRAALLGGMGEKKFYTGLIHPVEEFLARNPEALNAGLDEATAREWSQAVLVTWRDLVRAELPGALRAEFEGLRQLLKRNSL